MNIHLDASITVIRKQLTDMIGRMPEAGRLAFTDDPDDADVILRWYTIGDRRPLPADKPCLLLMLGGANAPVGLPGNVTPVENVWNQVPALLRDLLEKETGA